MVYDDFFAAIKRKIICFGAGRRAAALLNAPAAAGFLDQIVFFVDNDPEKQGATIMCADRALPVFPPEKLREAPDAVLLITVADRAAIRAIQRQARGLMGDSARCFSWAEVCADSCLAAAFGRENGGPRFILLNTPSYDNVGDHAIAMAERAFFQARYQNGLVEIQDWLCRGNLEALSAHIRENDVLLLTGGGHLGSLWPLAGGVISGVIERFPRNNIIVLPQSVHYGADEDDRRYLAADAALFNAHPRLMLCARDRESYRKMGRHFPSRPRMLVPDMALLMGWPAVSARAGIGLCLRSDKEGIVTEGEAERIASAARSARAPVSAVSQTRAGINAANSERGVLEKLCEYSSFRCVITDRLHGLVFSAITGTPCLALDNFYGKNRALYESWLKGVSSIRFIADPAAEDWAAAIAAMLEMRRPAAYDAAAARPLFTPLADYVSSLEGVVRLA